MDQINLKGTSLRLVLLNRLYSRILYSTISWKICLNIGSTVSDCDLLGPLLHEKLCQ